MRYANVRVFLRDDRRLIGTIDSIDIDKRVMQPGGIVHFTYLRPITTQVLSGHDLKPPADPRVTAFVVELDDGRLGLAVDDEAALANVPGFHVLG